MSHRCTVCRLGIAPDEKKRVRVEGITMRGSTDWIWGPVAVHDDCRLRLTMPHDSILGDFVATYGWVRA